MGAGPRTKASPVPTIGPRAGLLETLWPSKEGLVLFGRFGMPGNLAAGLGTEILG